MCVSASRARPPRDGVARERATSAFHEPGGRALARASFCAALAAGVFTAQPAGAQEIRLGAGRLAREQIYAVTGEHIPRRTDAWMWLALGGTPAPERAASPFGGLGAQISNIVVRIGSTGAFPTELRWGPWGQLWADGFGGRAEGGLAAQIYLFGRGVHTPVDVRFGGGYGQDTLGKTPHLAVTISSGPRYIEGVSWHNELNGLEAPQLVAGWRFFLTGRRTIEPEARYWVTGGIELELGITVRADPRPLEDAP